MDRAGPLFETFSDRIKLFLAVDGQVLALGEVLAQETVGVLAGSPFPGAMRVAEIDLDPGLGGQLGMARHIFALVIGQRLAHRLSNAVELTRVARQGGGGSGLVHLGQQDQAGGPFDQNPHRRAVTRPLEEVTFPVAGQGTVLHRRREHMNTQNINQLHAPIRTPGAWQAGTVGLAQAGDQFLAQGTPGQGVEAAVDGVGGDPPLRGVRSNHLQGAGDLTGRPTRDIRRWGISPPFPSNRRGGTTQDPRHGAQTLPLVSHHHGRSALFSRQLFVMRAHCNTLKRRGVALDSRLRYPHDC